MDAIIQSIQSMAGSADEFERKKLIDTLHSVIHSIEGPQEFMQRLLYSHVNISVARVGCDLKLYNHVADSPTPVSAQFVAEKAGADPELVARLLRYLASIGTLDEAGAGLFKANTQTKTLADDAWQSAIVHNFDTAWPCYLAMPAFLRETAHRDVTDPKHSPFNKAFDTKTDFFEWLPQQPWLFTNFNTYMTVQRQGMPTWLDKYPYKDRTQGMQPNQVFFVDIGGGMGHQSAALRDALPKDMAHRIVVQDQAAVTAQSVKKQGVENIVHDFWEPQPIKGARIYYMRNIIHDWSDDKSLDILRNTKSAMGPDSLLLIDDMVLPNEGAHWQATQLDIHMMTVLGSRERSKAQWETLIARAGLQINAIHEYTESLGDSIIECVLPPDSGKPFDTVGRALPPLMEGHVELVRAIGE
ncbi:hypothetical protein QQS21_003237 [Conoideocrella luteorostrata]|uniref:O-methyltransferase domain-containing protein n=1 Tax=Conoideocrella luteorostrata TaxID=1105319 RepID=A0AAJ0G2D0_9HYPO|nr:hypothetical protein QQS21_003237 [Conoideocrella luteorostrata]